MKSLLILALFISTSCFAQSGADALLDNLGEKPRPKTAKVKTHQQPGIKRQVTGDAFQQQLDVQVQNHTHLSFDIKQWAQAVMDDEFTHAAHLWTAIQMQIPANFRDQAEATQLYLLWKLGLNQTFFDQWVRDLANSEYAKSNPELTLETLVTPGLDAWLLRNALLV